MKTISATVIGLITGSAMVLLSLGAYFYLHSFDNALQYIVYFVYTAGIIWAITRFHKSPENNGKFGSYFSHGFKCFIVVTLMMVLFTYLFLETHPGFKDEMAAGYRKQLMEQGNHQVREIDELVSKARGQFTLMLTSMAIFGYLVIGSMITVIGSAFFMFNRKSANTNQ